MHFVLFFSLEKETFVALLQVGALQAIGLVVQW
jgi:hypothetical protein